jgi:hypothetical protein
MALGFKFIIFDSILFMVKNSSTCEDIIQTSRFEFYLANMTRVSEEPFDQVNLRIHCYK